MPTEAVTADDNAALDLDEIGKRLRDALKSLDVDGKTFAAKSGVPYSTMRAYLSGTRAPGPELLAGAYRAFGLMPSWLLTGDGAWRKDAGDQAIGEFTVVPVLPVQAGAGNGVIAEDAVDYELPGLCFRTDWLAKRRLNKRSLAVIEVRGSSMEPVLTHGDQVLVDRDDRQPRSGIVYVLRQGEELLVKYCQLQPGGILKVSSANAAYQPYDVELGKTPDVEIVGRVVASMHEW